MFFIKVLYPEFYHPPAHICSAGPTNNVDQREKDRMTIRLPRLNLKPHITDYRLPYDSRKLKFRSSPTDFYPRQSLPEISAFDPVDSKR